ncbi:hypothetical protein [Kitasatospora kifunensis]|uniref:Uncharacterized protein n=1 Tax=Kitasatospora kifunensis TaxID=58351 RepID=A0A7W7R4L1_KITKI|nr:hypothetical protein [Kitasatospora kifunensis]MBB4925239.1 hypothetical protein [Kitasatospora kifunensis]
MGSFSSTFWRLTVGHWACGACGTGAPDGLGEFTGEGELLPLGEATGEDQVLPLGEGTGEDQVLPLGEGTGEDHALPLGDAVGEDQAPAVGEDQGLAVGEDQALVLGEAMGEGEVVLANALGPTMAVSTTALPSAVAAAAKRIFIRSPCSGVYVRTSQELHGR